MSDPSRKPSSPTPLGKRLRKTLGSMSLVPREQRFYDLFERQAATLVQAGDLLKQALDEGENLQARQREIKDLEHVGDNLTQEIVRVLYGTFVTPFDHEDIMALATGLDDILDYIEEVADTINLYKITTVPEPARELAGLIAQAVVQLEQAIGNLRSGKNGSDHDNEVHRLEDVGDATSRRAIAELFSDQHPPLEVIKLKDLYDLLEEALDQCESVANVLEGIAIKNA